MLKEVPQDKTIQKDVEGALSGFRSWTNKNGRTIEGALLSVGDDLAKFQMRNGQTYRYKLDNLSQKSRKEIRKLAIKVEADK